MRLRQSYACDQGVINIFVVFNFQRKVQVIFDIFYVSV